MLPAEHNYKTYNPKLLAIVKKLKVRYHYLEETTYIFSVLIDHNNLKKVIKIIYLID